MESMESNHNQFQVLRGVRPPLWLHSLGGRLPPKPRLPRAKGGPRAALRRLLPPLGRQRLRYARHGGPSLRSPPLALRRRWRLGRASPPLRPPPPLRFGPGLLGAACLVGPPPRPVLGGREPPTRWPVRLVWAASHALRGVAPPPWSAWLALPLARAPGVALALVGSRLAPPRRHRGAPLRPGALAPARRLAKARRLGPSVGAARGRLCRPRPCAPPAPGPRRAEGRPPFLRPRPRGEPLPGQRSRAL